MVNLVTPDAAYERSYRGYVRELQNAGEEPIPFTLGYDPTDFAALLDRMEHPIPRPGRVPHSTYWLIEKDEVVGVSNLRHRLNVALRRSGGHIGHGVRPSARRRGLGTTLLRLTLARAAALGIDRVLITCDKRNIASARVARNNGAVLTWEGPGEHSGETEQHYWIDLIDLRKEIR